MPTFTPQLRTAGRTVSKPSEARNTGDRSDASYDVDDFTDDDAFNFADCQLRPKPLAGIYMVYLLIGY